MTAFENPLGEPTNRHPNQTPTKDNPRISRRRYLTLKAVIAGADAFTATEAVASTALAHPEWDMDEQKTWAEWEAS